MQRWHPEHLELSVTTAPCSFLVRAPGVEHIFMQPASVQCIQRWLTKSHRTGSVSEGHSTNLILLKLTAVRSVGFSNFPLNLVCFAGRSFHCLQATWQARQPVQRSGIISIDFFPIYITPPYAFAMLTRQAFVSC